MKVEKNFKCNASQKSMCKSRLLIVDHRNTAQAKLIINESYYKNTRVGRRPKETSTMKYLDKGSTEILSQ